MTERLQQKFQAGFVSIKLSQVLIVLMWENFSTRLSSLMVKTTLR